MVRHCAALSALCDFSLHFPATLSYIIHILDCGSCHCTAESALLGRSLQELEDLAKQHGQPAYRGKQLHDKLLQGAIALNDFSNVRTHTHKDCQQQLATKMEALCLAKGGSFLYGCYWAMHYNEVCMGHAILCHPLILLYVQPRACSKLLVNQCTCRLCYCVISQKLPCCLQSRSEVHLQQHVPMFDTTISASLHEIAHMLTWIVSPTTHASKFAKADFISIACITMQVPKAWRQQRADAGFTTGRSTIHRQDVAPDGTRKLLLRLTDGRIVETVGIPATQKGQDRLTVCVSSQVRGGVHFLPQNLLSSCMLIVHVDEACMLARAGDVCYRSCMLL